MAKIISKFGNRHKRWGPCVTLLRVCVRGVCTAARFQIRDMPCRFGCGLDTDRLEHFFQCPILVGACSSLLERLRVRLRHIIIVNGVLQVGVLLLCDGCERPHCDDAVLLGLLDAIVQAHNQLRHSGQQLGSHGLAQLLLSRLKHLRTISSSFANDFTKGRDP